jgi:hypothetical protein
MAVSKVALMQPLPESRTGDQPDRPGHRRRPIAGMTAASSLARQGYETHLVEKSDRNWAARPEPVSKPPAGDDIQESWPS